MRLLVDNQLPAALARFLADRGLECQHVLDVSLAQATDLEIRRYATSHQMIVVSLAAEPGPPPPYCLITVPSRRRMTPQPPW